MPTDQRKSVETKCGVMTYIDISVLRDLLLHLLVDFANLVRFYFSGVEIFSCATSNVSSKLCARAQVVRSVYTGN